MFSRLLYAVRCSPLLRTRCRRATALLQEYLDGSCEFADAEMVRRHLADCRPCGLEAAVYRRLLDSLATGRSVPPDAVRRLEEFADRLGEAGTDEDGVRG